MEEGQKWKIQDVGRLLKESVKAILHGQFLLRLNIGRYFIHIVYEGISSTSCIPSSSSAC